MRHWLDMVVVLLEAETSNLLDLCRIAGGNPRTFYRGIDPKRLALDERDLDELYIPGAAGTKSWEHPTIIYQLEDGAQLKSLYIEECRSVAKATATKFAPDKKLATALGRVVDVFCSTARARVDPVDRARYLYRILHDERVAPKFASQSDILMRSTEDAYAKFLLKISARGLVAHNFGFRLLSAVARDAFDSPSRPERMLDVDPFSEAAVRSFERNVERSFDMLVQRVFVHASVPERQREYERFALPMRRVRNARRQEERLAIFMDQILADRQVGLDLLSRYRDRAKFANTWLDLVRSAIIQNQDPSQDQLVIGKIVQNVYSSVFPNSRGYVLLYFALHLGKYSTIKSTIRTILDRSYSMFVERHRRAIEQALDGNRDTAVDKPLTKLK